MNKQAYVYVCVRTERETEGNLGAWRPCGGTTCLLVLHDGGVIHSTVVLVTPIRGIRIIGRGSGSGSRCNSGSAGLLGLCTITWP